VTALAPDERPGTAATRQRALARDDVQRLLDATSEPWRAIFAVMLFTGMRVSEALGLRWRSIDFDGG
jgi:integrase